MKRIKRLICRFKGHELQPWTSPLAQLMVIAAQHGLDSTSHAPLRGEFCTRCGGRWAIEGVVRPERVA